MRQLVKVPNPVLRQKSKPVETITLEVKELAQEMVDYMYAYHLDELAPVGFSAPQLGELIRVVTFYPDVEFREKEGIEVLINPELTKLGDFVYAYETCLSVPGKRYLLRRAKTAKMRGLTLGGELRTFEGRGVLAQIFQHEIDHLNGVLIDKTGKLVVD